MNPAIDRMVSVDKLVFEDRAYILDQAEVAGGRGVNASRVIHAFGGKTRALLTSGGAAGERMMKLLAGMGFPCEAVPCAAESRVNLVITDKQGLTVKLNEVGATLDTRELDCMRELIEARLKDSVRWLMICGSLQPGVRAKFYCELIELARSRGVKVLLDSDGDAFECALQARPTAISPNQQEAERLLGRALITRLLSLLLFQQAQTLLVPLPVPNKQVIGVGCRSLLQGAFADAVTHDWPSSEVGFGASFSIGC